MIVGDEDGRMGHRGLSRTGKPSGLTQLFAVAPSAVYGVGRAANCCDVKDVQVKLDESQS